MSIQRGSTPTHTFTTDLDLTSASEIFVTYKQLGRVVAEKTKADCTVTSTSVVTELSQVDTLRLDARYPVDVQLRVKFADGKSAASEEIQLDVADVLKEGVI